MEKIICIDGHEVKFRATASVPRLYRIKFKRDIMQDMASIAKDIKSSETGGDDISISSLEMFENVAYIMARHAAPDEVPGDIGDWLDEFDTFSIYQVFPELAALWMDNMETLADSKKKSNPAPVK